MDVITVMVRNGGTGEIRIHPADESGRRAVILQQDLEPRRHLGWLEPGEVPGGCRIHDQPSPIFNSWQAAALTVYIAFAFTPT